MSHNISTHATLTRGRLVQTELRGPEDRQTDREGGEGKIFPSPMATKRKDWTWAKWEEGNEEDMRKNGMVSPPPRNTLLLTRADALDHLDAAALADVDGRQRQGPVEGVAARRVRVAVALEAPHPATG